MTRHRLRLTVVLGFLLLSTAGIFSVSPQGAAQNTELACRQFVPQPEHPLEMNTVVSDPRTSQFATPLVKHVVMEKFVLECFEGPVAEDRRFIRDVEIFIEIVQRVQAGRTTTVEKRVEEAVCTKSAPSGAAVPLTVDCSAREVPLPQVPSERFQCEALSQPQPTDPVEMNTVITARQDTVVTMKVEKEIFFCEVETPPGAPLRTGFGHLFLFTEIVEQRAGATGGDNVRPTEKKFQGIMCLVSDIEDRVVECGHFVPAAAPPA